MAAVARAAMIQDARILMVVGGCCWGESIK